MAYQVSIKNIEGKDKLIISIDFDKNGVDSGTGKSLTLATTRGNQAIMLPDGTQCKLGVNCYKAK